MDTALRAEARLRRKNQLTLPEPIAEALDVEPGDVLVFETDPAEPGTARVRVVPRGLAGALTGTYGTTDELKRWLGEERAAWGE
jgi:bifunctional DNA-binding transcriptional regulator/antitoxin component of YhaV-PrlF toxin-antitoxin module